MQLGLGADCSRVACFLRGGLRRGVALVAGECCSLRAVGGGLSEAKNNIWDAAMCAYVGLRSRDVYVGFVECEYVAPQ